MAAGFDPCLEAAEAKNVLAPPSWSPRLPPGESRTPRAAGAQGIFAEKVSGKSTNGRHELDKAIKALGPGDTLIVVRLDRLARSIRDLLKLLDDIKAANARFRALDDPWCDTTTPQGELILTLMGGLAEFERKLIRQRCDEGIRRAKALGKKFGRKTALDAGQRKVIAERYAGGETMRGLGDGRNRGVINAFDLQNIRDFFRPVLATEGPL